MDVGKEREQERQLEGGKLLSTPHPGLAPAGEQVLNHRYLS